MTMPDPMTPTYLGTSDWTLSEARGMADDLAAIGSTDDERNGARLLSALIDHLDQLAGVNSLTAAENPLVTAAGRRRAAAVIGDIRAGSDRFRLDQPINAAVTLAEGRPLADRLATADGWQANVGRALQALYGYLDELYGGPGAFTELLSPHECERVAAAGPTP